MGRQTAVAMTDRDEGAFLTFLRSTADIQLLASRAPTKEATLVDGFAPREQGHWQYFIWNKAFPWWVEYGEIERDPTGRRNGWVYVRNASTGPVIEYDRHNFADRQGLSHGRVYWAKSWAAGPTGVHYDVDGFTRWYNEVVRWIRRHGEQRVKGAYNPYYLPDALSHGGAP